MNTKSALLLMIVSMVTPGFFLLPQGQALADFQFPRFPTPRMIMILDKGLDAHLLAIDRFTEVTWINDSNSPVKIKFGSGSDCKEISPAAFPGLGVRMQPDKCFVTTSIPPKGTLRFRFKEFGDYKYKVQYVGKSEADQGKIKVF